MRVDLNTALTAVVIALCVWLGTATVDVRERVARIEGYLSIPKAAKGKTMKLDIATIGANYSPAAYADPETGKPVSTPPQATLAAHRFYETDDHQLGHDIDGVQRAVIPPEGWADYALYWPACAGLVSQLQR